ncbi:MAG: tRNA glutamyl-Q(34) synthetase GluQRS [Granulosicoccus sp.]
MTNGQAPVGRFAPSPTGELHFGSLLAALASYCEARSKDGSWMLRIDDIDPPRSVAGSAEDIQKSLQDYGFEWDGPVQWQSQHQPRYSDALAELIEQRRIFECGCSRRQLQTGKVYPGTCREKIVTTRKPKVDDKALRLHLTGTQTLNDIVQGSVHVNLPMDCGDIVLWRRDGLVSYQLACAVDDAMTVSEVVRGADLLQNTGVQMAIMRYLHLPLPTYAHIPVAFDLNGDKLSKHSQARPISSFEPVDCLQRAWSFLGQDALEADTVENFWTNAIREWDISRVPRKSCCPV